MNRIARITLIAAAAMASLLAQETQSAPQAEQQVEKPAAAPQTDEAKPLIDALAAIGGIIAGADKPEVAEAKPLADGETAAPEQPLVRDGDPVETKSAPNGEPKAVKKPRSAKNSMILVTSGAAAGAAVGQAMGRNQKSAMIGAAVGGVVGLIYDRMTYKDPKGI